MRPKLPVHLIRLVLIIVRILGEDQAYRLRISSFCRFLHPPVSLSLQDPTVLLSTLFINTLSLCPSKQASNAKLINQYSLAINFTRWFQTHIHSYFRLESRVNRITTPVSLSLPLQFSIFIRVGIPSDSDYKFCWNTHTLCSRIRQAIIENR